MSQPQKPCELCVDEAGQPCYPIYADSPHGHSDFAIENPNIPGYTENPEEIGYGWYWCAQCGYGNPKGQAIKPAEKAPQAQESPLQLLQRAAAYLKRLPPQHEALRLVKDIEALLNAPAEARAVPAQAPTQTQVLEGNFYTQGLVGSLLHKPVWHAQVQGETLKFQMAAEFEEFLHLNAHDAQTYKDSYAKQLFRDGVTIKLTPIAAANVLKK